MEMTHLDAEGNGDAAMAQLLLAGCGLWRRRDWGRWAQAAGGWGSTSGGIGGGGGRAPARDFGGDGIGRRLAVGYGDGGIGGGGLG